jgi:hypothetical protein
MIVKETIQEEIDKLFNEKHLLASLKEYYQHLILVISGWKDTSGWDVFPTLKKPPSCELMTSSTICDVRTVLGQPRFSTSQGQYQCNMYGDGKTLNIHNYSITAVRTPRQQKPLTIKGVKVTIDDQDFLIHYPEGVVTLHHHQGISSIFAYGGGNIYIAQQSKSGTVIAVWDLYTHEFKKLLSGHNGNITSIYYHGNTLYSVDHKKKLIAWVGANHTKVSTVVESGSMASSSFYGFIAV